MFNCVKQPKRLSYFMNYFVVGKNHRLVTTVRPLVVNYSSRAFLTPTREGNLLTADQFRLVLLRNKSKGKKAARKYDEDESSDDEEEFEDDDEYGDDKNVKTCRVNSLRVDGVLKSALAISRKKIEGAFYENKIRLNGRIINKKSVNASENDEIDLINGFAKDSGHQINVHRVKILKAKLDPENEKILLKVWRVKSLTIDNYPDGSPWKQAEEEN